MSRAVRRGLIATVAVAVVVGLVATFASAASPAITFVSPSPDEGETLTTNAAQPCGRGVRPPARRQNPSTQVVTIKAPIRSRSSDRTRLAPDLILRV